jgi:hypothetical protein
MPDRMGVVQQPYHRSCVTDACGAACKRHSCIVCKCQAEQTARSRAEGLGTICLQVMVDWRACCVGLLTTHWALAQIMFMPSHVT